MLSATPTTLDAIRLWRDLYRLEMGCQIIHDSIHVRSGLTQEYALSVDGVMVGYGSVAVGGPWEGTPTAYEVYIVRSQRAHVFDLFRAFLESSGASYILTQSNAPLAMLMLHTFGAQVTTEAILFEDGVRTSHAAPPGAVFREPTASEAPDTHAQDLRWRGVIEVDRQIAASGGILFHYNRPFGDIYMDVEEPFRRRGFGTFIVQELKRLCYEGGHVPAARCGADNVASRRTLQKAGFVPCGNILKGTVTKL